MEEEEAEGALRGNGSRAEERKDPASSGVRPKSASRGAREAGEGSGRRRRWGGGTGGGGRRGALGSRRRCAPSPAAARRRPRPESQRAVGVSLLAGRVPRAPPPPATAPRPGSPARASTSAANELNALERGFPRPRPRELRAVSPLRPPGTSPCVAT